MATLLCESNMNFTSSSWKTVDVTSFMNSEAGSFNTTTSFAASTAVTTGAITVEGILIKFCRVASNSGTFTSEIYNSTAGASVAGTSVTISVSDLAFQTLNISVGGWIYLQFATPVTLLAATSYSVRVKSSVASSIVLNYNGTGSNYSKGLVTSTTAAPSTSDTLITAAPFTSTSTPSVITCTMNNTATTVFRGIELGAYSKFILENNASTNYNLKIASGGNFKVALNSELEFGKSSSRLNSTSTFTLEMQSSGAGANGIIIRSPAKFTAYGASKTRIDKLAANASAGATSLTTSTSTGWANGDEIIFAQTNRSSSATNEKKALTANASGTSLTITALTAAKLGTSPIQCDIGNVTSNIKFIGTSTSSTWYLYLTDQFAKGTHYLDIDNVEFQHLSTQGITIFGTTGSYINIANCGFHTSGVGNAIFTLSSNGIDNFIITGNVFYNCNISVESNTTVTLLGQKIINNNLVIGGATGISVSSQYGYILLNEFKNNIVSSCNTGISGVFSKQYNITTSYTGNKVYGNLGTGIVLILYEVIFNNITSYLNVETGINMTLVDTSIDTISSFGNGNYNLSFGVALNSFISNASIQSYSGSVSSYGIRITNTLVGVYISNSSIGTTVAHLTASITTSNSGHQLYLINTSIGDSTIINYGAVQYNRFAKICIQRLNGTAGDHKTIKPYGVLLNDTTIYDGTPSSLRLTPVMALYKLQSTNFQIAVANGATATFSVRVRKSVVGDGTAYNGNQPRLILKANSSAGSSYLADIVAATATSASNGAWETLTYTLPAAVTDNVGMEFYIDCDGTTGWVNVDTFVSNNNNSMKYYNNGEPINDISTGGGEKSFTFVG